MSLSEPIQLKSRPWLKPLSWLYRLFFTLSRIPYRFKFKKPVQCGAPVVVIGNLAVGGTGKTPLTIHLAKKIKAAGFHPGIVMRGYKGKAKQYPHLVSTSSAANEVGDEAIVIARHVNVPLAVDPKRSRAAKFLVKEHQCDVILCDDGLQHQALARDVEIAICQAEHQGAALLPSGPLREPLKRLKSVDFVVWRDGSDKKGYNLSLKPICLRQVKNKTKVCTLIQFAKEKVHAVAGIAHPKRFFDQLRELNYEVIEHPKPDHATLTLADITFDDDYPVIMTEKDAVKCIEFADDHHWFLEVAPEVSPRLATEVITQLRKNHG